MQRLPLPELCLFALFTVAGCMAIPGNPEKMSPEQLAAWAKDKNVNIACATAANMTGTTTMTYMVIDKGVLAAGNIALGDGCKVSVTAQPKP